MVIAMTSKKIIKELRKEIDKILQTGKSLRSYRIYQYLDVLEKDNPTFSDCIKEWGNRGFQVERKRLKRGYDISGFTAYQKEKFISISLKDKEYVWLSDETFLSFEEVQLLSKTLKALEETKDE